LLVLTRKVRQPPQLTARAFEPKSATSKHSASAFA
jgi:hypothetical protein